MEASNDFHANFANFPAATCDDPVYTHSGFGPRALLRRTINVILSLLLSLLLRWFSNTVTQHVDAVWVFTRSDNTLIIDGVPGVLHARFAENELLSRKNDFLCAT